MTPHIPGPWSPALAAVWYTPRDVARQRGVNPSKVMAWIRSGELEAVNHAASRSHRPRWRISVHALYMFDQARSNRVSVAPRRPSRRRRAENRAIKEFF